MCKEALSGRHYWEVEWSGYVRAGVTYRGIGRRTWHLDSALGHNERSWVLDHHPNSKTPYNYIQNAQVVPVKVSDHGFKRLGVYLDWPAGTLSYYIVSLNSVTHLHTFRTKFNEAVYPAFLIGFPGGTRNGEIKLFWNVVGYFNPGILCFMESWDKIVFMYVRKWW